MASYVAKVQFENSLRRLSLGVDPTSFSYSQLVGRARDLFQIPTNTKLLLTYVDCDGDAVTMADDQDVQDAVVMQSLNPLRLNVAVVNDGVETADVDSKVDYHSDSVAENNHDTTAAAVATNGEDGNGTATNTKVPAGPSIGENSNIDGQRPAAPGDEPRQEGFAKEDAQQPRLANDGQVQSDESAQAKTNNNAGSKVPADATATEAAHQKPVHYGIICDGCALRYIRGPRYKSVKKEDYDLCQACFEKPGVDPKEFIIFKKARPYGVAVSVHGSRNGCAAGSCPGMEKEATTQPTAPAATDGEVFHYRVVCDGCNTTPLVGPRFKSNKKDDYDLCQSCMQKVEGSASDEYTRIDRPVDQTHPHMFTGKFYRAFPPYPLFPFMPFGRPWCSRRIHVTGVFPYGNDEVTQTDVTTEGETDHNAEATREPEKAQKEAEIVQGTQEAVTADADGKTVNVEENTSTLPAQSEAQKADDLKAQQAPSEDVSTFDGMLAKLAAMGFTDNNLNAELLKKNNSNLRMTLDDLCAAEEWDPILEELQEMGFYDSDLNRRLLFQNNGNMKSVLKELVSMAKLGSSKVSKGEKKA